MLAQCPRCKAVMQRQRDRFEHSKQVFMPTYFCQECDDYYGYDEYQDYFYRKYSAKKLKSTKEREAFNKANFDKPVGGPAYCLVNYSQRKPEIIPDAEFLEYLQEVKKKLK